MVKRKVNRETQEATDRKPIVFVVGWIWIGSLDR